MLRAEAGFKISSQNYLTCADFPQLKVKVFLLVLIVAFTILFLKKKKKWLTVSCFVVSFKNAFLRGSFKAKENDSSPLLVMVTKISLGECFHFRLKQSVYYSNRTIGI